MSGLRFKSKYLALCASIYKATEYKINTKKGKLLPKHEEISGREAHTKTQKLFDIF